MIVNKIAHLEAIRIHIADMLEISLDYLAGNAEQKLDKATLKRILEIDKLQPKDKEIVFTFLDVFLQKTKLQQLLQ